VAWSPYVGDDDLFRAGRRSHCSGAAELADADRGGRVVVKMHPRTEAMRSDSLTVNPLFARRAEDLLVPRFVLPRRGMLPETAYQLVHDEAMLDGNARLNLATFVTTWMEPLAAQLYRDTFDKNMIDKDEYPLTAAIEERCWRMLADLWHAPDPKTTIGTSTVGSSEACMLGGLALKRRWQTARRAAGKSAAKPNLVMSSAVQVVWEKFATY
jgi:glutamate decarboxylase